MMTILIVAGLLAICFLGLGFNIFFRKNGKFPETEIERNREMRRRGIHCVKQEEMVRFKRARKLKELNECCGCSSGLCGDEPFQG
jgi:hypothetical protein